MSDFGLISVIVPVYNGEAFIAQAIESILAQEYEPLEIIVVDDGSTDQTAAVVQQFGARVQYHAQANSGSSAARNCGVGLAQGAWLAFLDADDLWTPGKLQKQTTIMQKDPTVELVWGHVQEFTGNPPAKPDPATVVPGHHPGTMLIKRSAFSKVGAFDTAFQTTEVVEWMSRALQVNLNQVMLPDVLMYRRLHQTNKGRNGRYSRYEYLHVLKQHLDRQRSNK